MILYLDSLDLKKRNSRKSQTPNWIKKFFKILGCCEDKSYSDVCEVWIKGSSTAHKPYKLSKKSLAKNDLLIYKTKQWNFYTKLMSAEARHIIAKIVETRKTELFGKYCDTKLIWNLFCESFLLFCIQPDLQNCRFFWSYIWQSEITIELNTFFMELSFR